MIKPEKGVCVHPVTVHLLIGNDENDTERIPRVNSNGVHRGSRATAASIFI